MTRVAVATTSQLAADAAERIAADGGNAVDCALAASLLTMNTEPGVCALAGSAFIAIWQPGEDPVMIDGNVAVPGIGLPDARRGGGATPVTMAYGGGIETLVGAGSVAVPGSLAALALASERYGRIAWRKLFEPSIDATRNGFSLPSACHYYLRYSGKTVFGRSDEGFEALHDDGELRPPGSLIVIPGLADTLSAIADDGAELFYRGELGRRIAEHCAAGGASLTRRDLAEYQAIERAALRCDVGDWQLATNPPPAVGGAMLAALITCCRALPENCWNRETLRVLYASQRACLDHRRRHLDLSDDVSAAVEVLLRQARDRRMLSRYLSASTVHTSAVDANGVACSITASSGYGSGEMPSGTGLWLNNCIGEIELNRRGLDAGPPGSRLPSNMAPSIARRGRNVLAVGSPGADRITTALQQFLINHLQFEMPLDAAIAEPRLHVDTSGEQPRLMTEPLAEMPPVDLPVTRYDTLSMYFGGVAAASLSEADGLTAAADPRREGATCICG